MKILGIFVLMMSFTLSTALQAETLHYTNSDFAITGNAVFDSGTNEFQLTQDAPNQAGNLLSKNPICAKEYKISFDLFAGDKNASANGGAGVVFYEVDAKTSSWASVVEWNTQDRARSGNYNFMELFNFGVSPNVLKAQPIPFPLGGAGYSHIDIHINEGVTTALITNPKGVLSIANQRNFIAGNPINHRFYSWSGVARNRTAVKDIRLQILRADNCSGTPTLNNENAKQDVLSTCGADTCASYSEFFSCAVERLEDLKQTGTIDSSTMDSITSDYQSKLNYCAGNLECKTNLDSLLSTEHDKGFSAGVLSVDKDALFNDGFNTGVKSVPVETLKKLSFDDGFSSGIKSLDVEAIKKLNFDSGVDSVNTPLIRQSGYESGYQAGLASAPSCEKDDDRKKWNLRDSIKVTPNVRDCSDKQAWSIRNNNKFPVQASYKVKRTGEKGTLTLKPGDTEVRVKGDSDPDSLEVIINDELLSKTECGGFKKPDNKKSNGKH